MAKGKPFKVTWKSETKGIVASSLQELKKKSSEMYKITSTITVHLDDSKLTDVCDEEFFEMLDKWTFLIITDGVKNLTDPEKKIYAGPLDITSDIIALKKKNSELEKNYLELRDDFDYLMIDKGYLIIGEAACSIINAYEGRKTALSPRKPLKRLQPHMTLPKPVLEDGVITEADLENAWPAPTQEVFDVFNESMRETRHVISHEGGNLPASELKIRYDKTIRAMKRKTSVENSIVTNYDLQVKKTKPDVDVPGFSQIIELKPHF